MYSGENCQTQPSRRGFTSTDFASNFWGSLKELLTFSEGTVEILWGYFWNTFTEILRYFVVLKQPSCRRFASAVSTWNFCFLNGAGSLQSKVQIWVHLVQVCSVCGHHSSNCSYDEAGETGQVFDKEIWVIDVKWYDLWWVPFEMLGHGGDILGDVGPDRWVTWEWHSCNWPNSQMRRNQNWARFCSLKKNNFAVEV